MTHETCKVFYHSVQYMYLTVCWIAGTENLPTCTTPHQLATTRKGDMMGQFPDLYLI